MLMHTQYIYEVRDLSQQSDNAQYRIAAKLHGATPHNAIISYGQSNIQLSALADIPDKPASLGGVSDTIHAETAVIMGAGYSNHADLYVTDPLCPNCMKNMIAAGIARIFIDANGFDKIWYQRRAVYFDHISVPMAKKAGVEIYRVDVDAQCAHILDYSIDGKAGNAASLIQSAPISLSHITPFSFEEYHGISDKMQDDVLVYHAGLDQGTVMFDDLIDHYQANYPDQPFAFAVGRDLDGNAVVIHMGETYPNGFDTQKDAALLTQMRKYNQGQKYRMRLDPVTRLLMGASRFGVSLRGAALYSSAVPSARCLINVVGYGMKQIHIGSMTADLTSNMSHPTRHQNNLKALETLKEYGVLAVISGDAS